MVALTSAQIRLSFLKNRDPAMGRDFLCRLGSLDRDTVLVFYSENEGGG
jgi:hypothetical protein